MGGYGWGRQRTHEEVVGVRVGATDLEQLHQIMELAVYITTDGDGAFLCDSERVSNSQQEGHVPLAVRWTRPEVPRGPVTRCLSEKAVPAAVLHQTMSHTLSHSLCTSLSASCLQLMRLSIQPSSVGIVVGSEAGADDSCMGSGILTSSILVSMVAGRRDRCRWGGRSGVVM
jgi:hypothetical protein